MLIKDINDSIVQLMDRVKDARFASEAREILKMFGELQSEHAEMRERNFRLMQKNADIKKEIESLMQW